MSLLPSQRQVWLTVVIAAVLQLQPHPAFGSTTDQACSAQSLHNGSQTGVAAVDPMPILEQAHQIALLARQLEDTQQMLQYKHLMGPSNGFRYKTFALGMLFAWALVAVIALLGWEYMRHHLQRKQQAAVVGGLKDMDDDTLKKVLGKVSIALTLVSFKFCFSENCPLIELPHTSTAVCICCYIHS